MEFLKMRRRFMDKIIAIMLAVTTVLSTGCKKEEPAMRDISTVEVVKEMGFGINLGNTMESCGDWIPSSNVSNYETAWGSPIITQPTIQGYADAGFGVLRIPVAWSNMMIDDGNYTIHPDYIARVKEIVDWTLDTGMYAIINIHWDNGWISKFPENKEESMRRYKLMWTQIADIFKDYDDKLMFESQNEALGWESMWNRWSGVEGEEKEASYNLVNEINQAFVDVVRSSGGNNPERHLLISGYNTDIQLTTDPLFKMPNDPAGRMAVSVHYYTPSTLCLLEEDAEWGKAKTTWGSEEDYAQLNGDIKMLKERFTDNGIPVIVGEYGCYGKNKAREVCEQWMLDVSSGMYEIGACPVLWDTAGNEFNRYDGSMRNPDFIAKLVAPSASAKTESEAA